MIKLTGRQQAKFEEALISAFPSRDELARMVQYRLSRNLEAIAMGDNLSIIVFKLIQEAQAQGWIESLIARAREANPGNSLLAEFCRSINLSPQTPDTNALERIINQQNSFLDVNTWRQKLGELENQVCRVEVCLNNGKVSSGTGFLIGPSLILTNYHVMQEVIESHALQSAGKAWAMPQNVFFRFDYKMISGNVVNPGVVYPLAEDWLVESSPMSQWDYISPPKAGDPEPGELDFALLRLNGAPGDEPIGINPQPGSPKRGWIKAPERKHTFEINSPLLILQHPKAAPLKLAFDTNAILGVNSNNTRVTYRTNTEHGSSGSPCFNLNWELTALHHAGDPDSFAPHYNQGIPIGAILDFLEVRGKREIING